MAKSSLRFNFPLRTIGTCTVAGFTGVGSGAGSLPISQNTFSYAIDGPLGDQGASYAFSTIATFMSDRSATGTATLTMNDPTRPAPCSSNTLVTTWTAAR